MFTADGIGDNVSYSIRTLKDGALACHFGDDRFLLKKLAANSIGQAYSFATALCGFTKLRHEGKLTGLAAYGEPTLAAEIARHFRIGDDGLVATRFPGEVEIGDEMARICQGASRETIAASIQKVTEDLMLAVVRHWLDRHKVRHLGLGGGLFANVRLNRLLAESCPLDEVFVFPAMGDDGLCVGAALVVPARARRPRRVARQPLPARHGLSRPRLRRRHRCGARGDHRRAPRPGRAARDARSSASPPARSAPPISAAWSSARARSAPAASWRARPTTRSTTTSTAGSSAPSSCRSRPTCSTRTPTRCSRSRRSTATRRAS